MYKPPPMESKQALALAAAVMEMEATNPRPDLPSCKEWKREAAEAARLLWQLARSAPEPTGPASTAPPSAPPERGHRRRASHRGLKL